MSESLTSRTPITSLVLELSRFSTVSSEYRQNFVTESPVGLMRSRGARTMPRVEFQMHSHDALGRKTGRSNDRRLPKDTPPALDEAACTSFYDRLVPSL